MFGEIDKPEKVKKPEHLAKYLTYLKEDFRKNQDKWECNDIASYLESISRWLTDGGVAELQGQTIPLSEIANLFYVGKIYE